MKNKRRFKLRNIDPNLRQLALEVAAILTIIFLPVHDVFKAMLIVAVAYVFYRLVLQPHGSFDQAYNKNLRAMLDKRDEVIDRLNELLQQTLENYRTLQTKLKKEKMVAELRDLKGRKTVDKEI